MASGVRITLVGGGSVQWGPPLITDLMLTQSLAGGRLVLYDIDHPAVEQMARLARRIAAETRSGSPPKLAPVGRSRLRMTWIRPWWIICRARWWWDARPIWGRVG
jgi:hypothetical protein